MQRRLIGISTFLLLFAAALVSQTANQAQVTGTVMDQTGSLIAKAAVELKQTPSGGRWTASTDSRGRYELRNLPGGSFELSVTAPGFKKYVRAFSLSGGQTLRADVAMAPGSANETVVSGEMGKTERDREVAAGPPAPPPPPPPAPKTAAPPQSQIGGAPGGAKGGGKGAKGGPGGGGGRGGNASSSQGRSSQQAGQQQGNYDRGISDELYRNIGEGRYNSSIDDIDRRRPLPPVNPGSEEYGRYVENGFVSTHEEPLSTFSTDVDTASYANLRRFLTDGQLPPTDSVRIEELINYFRYEYPAPERGKPVSMTTHLVRNPWNSQRQLLLVGLRTTPMAAEDLPPSHLTFLIDVSGSMSSADKLPLLQQSMQMLTRQLRPQDTVAMVVYAGSAGVVLPPTKGNRQQEILDAVGRLQAGGSTNGAGGIRLAYDLARQQFSKESNNRVILATDGDFNVGVSSDDELVRLIENERKSGVFLSVLGFGTGNLKDSKMEKLADHGNGNYSYIDSLSEARKVFVQEMGATLVTVAKDVKLQIEFNPARVRGYRLVGYENRLLRPEDFNNDAKDAGDLGAGHQVTAFYEIIPADSDESGAEIDGLRYRGQTQTQPERNVTTGNHPNELAWVKIRYKEPQGDRSSLMEWPVTARAGDFNSAPRDVRFAAAVAEYGLLLRRSRFAGSANYDHVMRTASEAIGSDLDGYRTDFLDLVRRAANLSGATISRR